MNMSWEIVGEWVLKVLIIYVVYFVSAFLITGVPLIVYLILGCWHERRGVRKMQNEEEVCEILNICEPTFIQKLEYALLWVAFVALIISAGLAVLTFIVVIVAALAIRVGVSFVCQKIWHMFHKKK